MFAPYIWIVRFVRYKHVFKLRTFLICWIVTYLFMYELILKNQYYKYYKCATIGPFSAQAKQSIIT